MKKKHLGTDGRSPMTRYRKVIDLKKRLSLALAVVMIGILIGGLPAWGARSKQGVYRAENHHIMELYCDTMLPSCSEGTQWRKADLTEITGAPLPIDDDRDPTLPLHSPLIGYDSPTFQSKQVVYISKTDGIIELFNQNQDGIWRWADLRAIAWRGGVQGTAPAPSSSELSAYAWKARGSKQVVYVSAENSHVIELFLVAGDDRWRWEDLTEIALGGPHANRGGAPLPARFSEPILVGYAWESRPSKQVVYIAENGHIIELYIVLGDQWRWADLTELTTAPIPIFSPLSAYAFEPGASKHVLYIDADGRIIELSVTLRTPWERAILNSSEPPEREGPLIGYAWNGFRQVVFQQGSHTSQMQGSRVESPSWRTTDLNGTGGDPEAPRAAPARFFEGVTTLGTPLTTDAYTLDALSRQVVYIARNGHIIELYSPGGGWKGANLTQITGAPPPLRRCTTSAPSVCYYSPISGYGRQ